MTNKLYTIAMELVIMSRKVSFAWGAVVIAVALLNIADVLPDWTTIAAILTLPVMATRQGRCLERTKA